MAASAAKDRHKRKSAKSEAEHATFTQAGTANLAPVEVVPPPSLLDSMSVRQAFALYQELHAMFNPGIKLI